MPKATRMAQAEAKARTARLDRLHKMLDEHLANPAPALETLMKELHEGETHEALWEKLHAAAARDGKEAPLADAYGKLTAPHRLKQLPQPERVGVLVHAADFYQGILGDGEAAGQYLRTVLAEVPGHREAFLRLERRLEAIGDRTRLVELYADAMNTDVKDPGALSSAVVNNVARLTGETPLSDKLCRKLLQLVPVNSSVMGTLEAHCRKTGRMALMADLIARALGAGRYPRPAWPSGGDASSSCTWDPPSSRTGPCPTSPKYWNRTRQTSRPRTRQTSSCPSRRWPQKPPPC